MREKRGSKYHLKSAINGAPAKRHLNGISLAAAVGPTLNTIFILVSRGYPLNPTMILWADFVKKVDFVAIRT